LPKEAALRDTIIFRKPSGGKLRMIKVDVIAMMTGKAEDVPIEDDDVILVNRKIQRTTPLGDKVPLRDIVLSREPSARWRDN
jgi:hypothetical protein